MATLTLKGVKDRAQPATETQETPAQDVPEVPAPTPELNPRNAAIAEIAKRASEKQQADSEELTQLYDDEAAKDEAAKDEEPEAEPEEVAAEPEAEAEQEQSAPEPEVPEKRMVTVKINGLVREVPEDELIATYQKERSADEKFQEAARLRDEAYAAMRQQPQQQQPTAPTDTKSLVEKIQFGSAEEAAQALETLQSLTVQQARQETERTILQRDLASFASDNSDLVNDPVTQGALMALDQHLSASGFQGTPRQRWDEAAKQVRARFQQPQTKATAPVKVDAAPSTSRVERKASITTVPTAAGRMESPQPTKPKSHHEIIESMRQGRMKGRNF